jgi:hypothetical protein
MDRIYCSFVLRLIIRPKYLSYVCNKDKLMYAKFKKNCWKIVLDYFFSAYKKITCSKHKIQERQLKNNFTIIDILLRLCPLKSRHIHILCKKYRCIIFIYYIYLYVVCKMKVTYRDMYCSYLCITMYHSYLYNMQNFTYTLHFAL